MNKKTGKHSIFTLMMLIVAAVASIRSLPSNAELGMQLIFFLGFSALVFFIPASLVSAELATGWSGGVFEWVKQAFGDRWGFIAIWLQWVQNIVWYPLILSFAAGALAYVINPVLARNGLFTASVVSCSYWLATFIALQGIDIAGMVGSWGVIIGTLLPGLIIMTLGGVYLLQRNPSAISLNPATIIPHSFSLPVIVFTVGIILSYAGVEMNANPERDVKNPGRTFPLAIFGAGFITVVLFILGSLAVAVVVPVKQLSLNAGVMEAYAIFLRTFHLSWAMPLVACLLIIGVFAGVITWISGPSRGLLYVGQLGFLPHFFQKTNRHGTQHTILLLQGVIVTILALLFVFIPDVSSSYWILTSMSVQLYLCMYIIMFVSALRLRTTQPTTPRAFRVRFMPLIGSIGISACLAAFLLGFVPPKTWTTSWWMYDLILSSGIILLGSGPVIFYALHRPEWKQVVLSTEKSYNS